MAVRPMRSSEFSAILKIHDDLNNGEYINKGERKMNVTIQRMTSNECRLTVVRKQNQCLYYKEDH
jgi:hypothetical protein